MGDASIKGRSPLLKGGRVGLKKGGFSIKTKKVKPGYDQEFTLPKGTSAAPIKQSKVKAQRKKEYETRKKIAEHAGPHEGKVIVKRIMGDRGATKKGDRKKAAIKDAMEERQSPWSGTSGAKVPHKKGGKVQ